MSPNFELHMTTTDDVPVLSASGELDMTNAAELTESLQAMADSSAKVVVADLSGVTFIDSTGLNALIVGRKRLEERGGELRLVMTHPHVLKVFEITGLLDVFPVHASVTEALPG